MTGSTHSTHSANSTRPPSAPAAGAGFPRLDPVGVAPETSCSTGPSPTVHLLGLGRVGQALAILVAEAGFRLVGATAP